MKKDELEEFVVKEKEFKEEEFKIVFEEEEEELKVEVKNEVMDVF